LGQGRPARDLVAGLELMRESVVGELSKLKQATLPIIAAIGDMVVPGDRGAERRLGFAGHRSSLVNPGGHRYRVRARSARADSVEPAERPRVFLLSLAVVDDLGAIIVIAVRFTASFDLLGLASPSSRWSATPGSSTGGCARHRSMCRSR
jgi:NhaA family Na+:H+ antiporter